MDEIIFTDQENVGEFDYDSVLNYLLNTLESIMKISNIKSEDNIFVLGADSLQAIKFATEISYKYGFPFKFNLLFKLKSISEIAEYIVKECS